MENVNPNDYSSLSLAYIGDALWEYKVREAMINKKLHHSKLVVEVKKHVNAKAQNKIYNEIVENIEEKDAEVAKRARNCNIKSYPKSCTPAEYRNATAFEALMGYYYYTGREELIDKLIQKYIY
jgi:ribonuclease-3 family protein